MGQKVKLKKFLSLLLVLAMILSMNMTVLADEPDGTASTVPASGANTGQANGMITAFAALGQTQYEVSLNDGVTQESIAGNLPQTLTATIDGAAVPITVTWSSGNFQAAEGNYTFTANADGYELAEGVAWPSVNVTLTGTNPAEGDGNTDVAELNGTKHTSLQAAITAAGESEAVITLLTDTEEQIVISEDQTITLDLNGKNLRCTSNDHTILINGGKLTIQDETVQSNPTVSEDYETVTYSSGCVSGKSYNSVISVENGGTLILEKGYIYSENSNGIWVEGNTTPGGEAISSSVTMNGGFVDAQEYGIGVAGNGAVADIKDGVIVGRDNAGIAGNGTNSNSISYAGTTINVDGGTIIGHIITSGYIACGIYHPQAGELNIAGGTIYADGGVGVLVRGGKMNMTGGKVIATGNTSGNVGDSTIVQNCYGIQIDGSSNYYDSPNSSVSISGDASVSAADSVPALNVTAGNSGSTENKMIVSGGTFSSEISPEYCADGFELIDNEDGTFSVSAEKVAQIGDNKYTSLEEAVGAVQAGQTIVLLQDINEDVVIPAEKTVTLDLNGKTLTNISSHTITNNGTLTITDTNTETETVGTVDNVTHAKAAIYNAEGATCTILAGQFTRSKENGQSSEDNGGNSFYTINNYGTMTIGSEDEDFNDDRITVTAKGHYSSLVHNGWQNSSDAVDKEAKMTIHGGTFTGGINTIKNDESGDLTITDGKFTNVTQYALMNWNKASISGGTFESNTSSAVYNGADATTSVGQLTITGGTFTAPDNYYVVNNVSNTGATVSITGGTYSSQYYTNNNSALTYTTEAVEGSTTYQVVLCTEENAVASSSNGTDTQYYPSLQKAVAGANTDDTVQLLQDIELSSSVIINQNENLTLDLNGCNITRANGNTTSYLIKVEEGGSLTIIDNSENSTGKIESSNFTVTDADGKSNLYAGFGVFNNGTLIVKSGTISGYYGIYNSGGDVTVENGNVTGTSTGIVTLGGKVKVQDGIISGTSPDYLGTGIALFNQNYDNESLPATCEITGGQVSGTTYGISCNNLYSGGTPGCQLTITGGKVTSENCAIYWPNNGKIIVGTENGNSDTPSIIGEGQGILICCGELVVNSGKIECTSTSEKNMTCDETNSETDDNFLYAFRHHSGSANMGDAITVVQNRSGSYAASPVKVTINGGSFIGGTNNNALRVLDCNKATGADSLTQDTNISVTNGSFTGSIDLEYAADSHVISGGSFSDIVDVNYCADGYVPTTEKDSATGMYTVTTEGAKLYGRTLTLNGTIGVNYYVDMSAVDEADRANYSMQFTVNGKDIIADYDASAYRTFGENQYYRFTCSVAAKQMTDTITARIMKNGVPVSKDYTYSVKTYCDNAIKNSGDNTLIALLKAMLNYGGYAQSYFKYKTEDLANAGLFESDDPVQSVTAEQLEAYEIATNGTLPTGIRLGTTLLLESDTTIRFYIYLDNEANVNNYTFAIDGSTCSPVANNGATVDQSAQYYIEVQGITAPDLDKAHTLTVSDASDSSSSYSVSYSALTYAYDTLTSNNDTNELLQNTVKALYLYNQETKQYTKWIAD